MGGQFTFKVTALTFLGEGDFSLPAPTLITVDNPDITVDNPVITVD